MPKPRQARGADAVVIPPSQPSLARRTKKVGPDQCSVYMPAYTSTDEFPLVLALGKLRAIVPPYRHKLAPGRAPCHLGLCAVLTHACVLSAFVFP